MASDICDLPNLKSLQLLTFVSVLLILYSRYPDVHIAIYTGDLDADPERILNKTEKTFNVKLRSNIEFVYLHGRKWVEASTYPYFTLLGQSLGSICLGIEALNNLTPGERMFKCVCIILPVSIEQGHMKSLCIIIQYLYKSQIYTLIQWVTRSHILYLNTSVVAESDRIHTIPLFRPIC